MQMLERAGAWLLAIHGRTREQKRASEVLADWEHVRAVKQVGTHGLLSDPARRQAWLVRKGCVADGNVACTGLPQIASCPLPSVLSPIRPCPGPCFPHHPQALRIPVLGNGNIRTLHDCEELMQATGVDGVMSAESLLVDPALFSRRRMQVREQLLGAVVRLRLLQIWCGCGGKKQSAACERSSQQPAMPHLHPGPACPLLWPQPGGEYGHLDGCHLLLEYLDLVDLHPTPWRMVKGHAFQLLGALRCCWRAGGWAGGWAGRLGHFTSHRSLLNRTRLSSVRHAPCS